MITDRLPYASRIATGEDGGASLADIVADQPAHHPEPIRRKDLRPIIILTIGICYSLTVGLVSVTVISINGSSTARACVETGGSWIINEHGDRECVRKESGR